MEIISESILQRPLPELTYIFIDIENNGLIKEWGYSNRVYMIYFKLLSIYEKSSADYCVIVLWIPKLIQQKFIEEISVKVNRNSQNFKFLAYQKSDRVFIPNQYKGNNILEAFPREQEINLQKNLK